MKNGKRVKGRGIGEEVGFVQGKHVFESATKGFEGRFYDNVQKFIDDVLDKGLS